MNTMAGHVHGAGCGCGTQPRVRSASYLSPHDMFRLDLACKPICEAFDTPPYLVGSVTERLDYRDIDVRLILDDDEYDRLVATVMLPMLNIAFTAYLQQATGLPIDFGIQQRSAANRLHDKPRNPLGLRHLGNFTGDAPLNEAP